jgi:hypothetical protein
MNQTGVTGAGKPLQARTKCESGADMKLQI